MSNDALKISLKRSLQNIFQDAALNEKKIEFEGPDGLRPDSRYGIQEICSDHIVCRLVGDATLILPYASITSLMNYPMKLVIRYR